MLPLVYCFHYLYKVLILYLLSQIEAPTKIEEYRVLSKSVNKQM